MKKESQLRSESGAAPKPSNYKYADLLYFLDDCPLINEGIETKYKDLTESFNYSKYSQDADGGTFEQVSVDVDSSDISSNCSQCSKRRKNTEDLFADTNAEVLKVMSTLKEDVKPTSVEQSFCENLANQLEAAKLPIVIFSKFQLAVYTAFNEAVQEKT